MKKISYLLYFCFVIAVFFTSCNTDEALLDVMPEGKAFFPLEKGRFVSYNITEKNYFLNEPTQTATYQLKEVIADSYQDLAFGTTYRIERYKRNNGRDNWTLFNVWTVRQTHQALIKNEDNVPYVKLVFPTELYKKWNSNSFNTLGEDTYEMRDFNKTVTFAGKKYDKTLTVIQQNDSTLVGKDKRREIYAEGIGMIYKKYDVVVYCQFDNCRGKAQIERGNVLEMSIFDSGKE
jgi:hypothetical protein